MQEFSDAFSKLINGVVHPYWLLLMATSFLISLFWLFSLARKMASAGQPGIRITFGEIIGVLVLATLVANYGGLLNSVSESLGMGSVTFGAISYIENGSSLGKFADMINTGLTFASMMGGFYGLKGGYLLHKKAKGESSDGDLALKGMIHIIAGACLVQLSYLLSATANSIA